MICPNCGAEVPEGAKFCIKCGTEIVPKTLQPDLAKADAGVQTAPDQALSQENVSKKKLWMGIGIGIGSAVIIVLIVVLVLALVHNHQLENQGNTAATSSSTAASVTEAQDSQQSNAASGDTSYVADYNLLTDAYIEKYENDLLGRLSTADHEIIETGFSKADDVNHIQSGHTHNSLCFIVESPDGYSLYEYADIKIDGNGNLLPAAYKGKSRTFRTENGMRNYLSDKPTDTYHYTTIYP